MNRSISMWGALLALVFASGVHAADSWKAGEHYFLVSPAQHTSVPAGKIEVAEVFSYGCPYCAQIVPIVNKLKAALPPSAQLVYVPASFLTKENWPTFQRAFFSAQALGLVDKTHEAMFDAVWKTNELSITDPKTRQLKNSLPSIEDVARFYARISNVKPETFLAASKSFGVDAKMRGADGFVTSTQSFSIPTFIVNGKYRLDAHSAGDYDKVIELVKFLVAKEAAAAKASAAAPATSKKAG